MADDILLSKCDDLSEHCKIISFPTYFSSNNTISVICVVETVTV